uniref:Aminotransferase-like plant mobile domain-containing protein n=1 Tax=Hordeum vulgare subsp. vulgare TaxID=112509 RepID=A0A8I6XMZ0_HORVV
MHYDERYTPYIEMTGLLPFVQLVSRSTPNLNAAAVTSLIDRWRPETHSFHLRTGEMTVTLQDVSMITALPIEGKPLCMSTDSEGWRHQMEALIGMSPQEPEVEDGGKKDRVPAGATFTWIAANFGHCPEDTDDEVIQRYARVYMWYVISRTIFADGTGKNAPWMWLKALTVFDNKFSWGLAALAYLYRQLDDACRRKTKDGGVGGCMLLLSVWSWERLPVGRPKSSKWNTWDDHGNPVRQPTWAYKWDLVSEVASEVNLLYKQYTNEMDSLTPEQVRWFQS